MNRVSLNGKSIAPGKIICIGRNYAAHIAELGNETPEQMVFFTKPNSAISESLHAKHGGEALHYEAELCFLIQDGKLHGVGIGLDLTKRGLQSKLKEKGLPWERAKAFDGAAVFSPFASYDGPLEDLNFKLHIDGQPQQHGTHELMIHKPDQILTEIQTFMSLNDGDILMTGTPKGVGVVRNGEEFNATVSAKESVLVQANWKAQG